ncbi:YutD family protein [Streptococcus ferus]|uniref:YutD family protein n=1 Tax=Streptococcus ferus TaxID=1345 RepID=UPI0035A15F50
MRKDISPDLYNYNKFPGPQFVFFDNHVKSDDLEFLLLENVKDAFDATVFSQRFSEILLKYDYIVGDWGNEQLRLKGFYKEADKKKSASTIARLDDYITEYCNFGCAYFVLENPNPKEMEKEEERPRNRRRDNRRRRRYSKSSKVDSPNKKQREDRPKSEKSRQAKETNQHFVIRQKKA